MSQKLISLNPDLRQLRDEGYEIEIKKGHLLVHHIPYATANRSVAFGVLVTPLGDLAGDKTKAPTDHVIFFVGDHPCYKDGTLLQAIQHSTGRRTLAEGIDVDHSFSNKPTNGYPDYYQKVVTYARIISAEAEALDATVRARTHRVISTEDDPNAVFNYLDTNSIRSGIEAISSRLQNLKIGIVGLGGTGSYVLDFVAKTPVREIHIFDEDTFLTHNAFRAPGAPSIETLRSEPKKVTYLHGIYSRMHKFVIPHEYHVSESNLADLSPLNFVFVCIDDGKTKKPIVESLVRSEIPFIDVGIGMEDVDGLLTGSARVTCVSPEKRDHIETRISFSDPEDNVYDSNVQIAEMNALNAALAVIKWKKRFGFYHDLEKEHHSTYEINVNKIVNDEIAA